MPSTTNILMVCLGNICRSPLAEGILKSKLPSEAFFIDSAGTSGLHQGELPDQRSIDIANKHAIDITDQKSRPFNPKTDFEKFDHIFVMDESNYQNLKKLTSNPNYHKKIKLILGQVSTNNNLNVPDPYYGKEKDFENVFLLLNQACEQIKNQFAAKYRSRSILSSRRCDCGNRHTSDLCRTRVCENL